MLFFLQQAQRGGLVKPEEEKAAGRPDGSLPVPERDLHESWKGTFDEAMLGQEEIALNWKTIDLY